MKTVLVFLLSVMLVGSARADLFGLVSTGELFVSADGSTWAVRSTLPFNDAIAVQALTSDVDLLVLTETGLVARSADGGVNWTYVGAIPTTHAVDMAVRQDGVVFAVTRRGTFYRSINAGATFTVQGGVAASDVVALALSDSGDVAVLTVTGSIYESLDDGVTWAATSTLPVSNAVVVEQVASASYVLTGSGEVYLSNNGGAWTAIGTVDQVGMRDLTWHEGTLIVATREGHIARSSDGATWTWVGSINQLGFAALATDTPAIPSSTEEDLSRNWRLDALWPNPAPQAQAWLRVMVGESDVIEVAVFDVRGRRVASGERSTLAAGVHELPLSYPELASGTYVIRVMNSARQFGVKRWVVLQ